jgi:hypothetical protein
MQIKYSRDYTKKTRDLKLQLSAEDLEGLPETLRLAFFRAEHTQRPAQLVSVWSRILGLQPADPQTDLFENGDGEKEPPDAED